MNFAAVSASEFNDALASREPVPGGGGASAMSGAMSAALGCMVCNLTIGKKKFLQYNGELRKALSGFENLRHRFLKLTDDDAKAFEPLSQAYKIPKDAEGRDNVMEKALIAAALVPLDIMKASAETIELFVSISDKSSAMVISDVGVGVKMAASAMSSASLNVYINTKLMKNREAAEVIEIEADKLLNQFLPLADEVFESVVSRLR